jgi:hypothetical protein
MSRYVQTFVPLLLAPLSLTPSQVKNPVSLSLSLSEGNPLYHCEILSIFSNICIYFIQAKIIISSQAFFLTIIVSFPHPIIPCPTLCYFWSSSERDRPRGALQRSLASSSAWDWVMDANAASLRHPTPLEIEQHYQ